MDERVLLWSCNLVGLGPLPLVSIWYYILHFNILTRAEVGDCSTGVFYLDQIKDVIGWFDGIGGEGLHRYCGAYVLGNSWRREQGSD